MSVPKLTNELFKTEPFSFFMQAHKFQAPHVESALRVDVLTVAVSLLFFFFSVFERYKLERLVPTIYTRLQGTKTVDKGTIIFWIMGNNNDLWIFF